MNEELTIRKAKLYDVPAHARIEEGSFDSPWSAEEITRDVTAESGVYVAVALAGDERAGYADMRLISGEAQIYNIAVAPDFRRQGVGEALLTHMIDVSRENNCELITLEVRAGNAAAMELYKKLGFKETGRRKGYYLKGGEDAVLMDMDLGGFDVDVEIV